MKKTRYYVMGIGYDKDDKITDYEKCFGDFDTYDEAKKLLLELMRRDRTSFFEAAKDLYQLYIEIQECEEDAEGSSCVDLLDIWWLLNRNYKESEN